MGLTLSTLLRRIGAGGTVPPAPPVARGSRPVRRPTADGAPSAWLEERAVRALGDADAPQALRELWQRLGPTERRAVADPVGVLGRHGRQTDGTTCGSAVLVMTAALGDPFLAAWLASGRLRDGVPRPSELRDAPAGALRSIADAPVAHRFAVLQHVTKRRTNARAVLGALPWPTTVGTPPWGAAHVARFAPVRYRHVVVDDTDDRHLSRVLDAVDRSVAAGVPVPLYSGGDTATGWTTAVPRHVVLAVDGDGDRLGVWEPSTGRRFEAGRSAVATGSAHRALGGWGHVVWALLPTA